MGGSCSPVEIQLAAVVQCGAADDLAAETRQILARARRRNRRLPLLGLLWLLWLLWRLLGGSDLTFLLLPWRLLFYFRSGLSRVGVAVWCCP